MAQARYKTVYSIVKTGQVVAELHAVFARKKTLIPAAATQAHRGSFDDFFGQKIRNFNYLHNCAQCTG